MPPVRAVPPVRGVNALGQRCEGLRQGRGESPTLWDVSFSTI